MVAVPRSWPGSTVVLLATGPSLNQVDADYCRGKARVIAINDAYKLAPWADCLYGTDARWYHWHKGVPSFTGPKWSLEHSQWGPYRAHYPDVQRLRNTGPGGIEHEPTGLKNGRNSGYAAINLAVHYGAVRVILLGYNMQPMKGKAHFWAENNGEHPNKQRSPYDQFRRRFESLKKPLAKLGVTVINCTEGSALTTFPKQPLREALPETAQVAA